MNQRTPLFASLALVAALGGGDDDDSKTIVDVAADSGDFTILVGALEATGLDATLSGDGPFTVFAPTDAAFERLPAGVLDSLDADTLSQILTYHVAAGEVGSDVVVTLDSATTVEGSNLNIQASSAGVFLNGVTQVIQTDVAADNGVIHAIDSVLLPPSIAFPGDIVQAAQAYPALDTLVGAVVSAELVDDLQSTNNGDGFTVFAPDNQAFADLDIDLSSLSASDLGNVLLYHTIGERVDSSAVVGLSEATTLQGASIDIAVSEGTVRLNGDASVVQVDLRTSNGIIHIIDSVLLPPQ